MTQVLPRRIQLSQETNVVEINEHIPASRLHVYVRIRPLSGEEVNLGLEPVWKKECKEDNTGTWLVSTINQEKDNAGPYLFDDVLQGEHCDNVQVYNRVVQPMLKHVLSGISACVLLYGQTSSGKTHTIRGSSRSSLSRFRQGQSRWKPSTSTNISGPGYCDGLIQLTCKDLFRYIHSCREGGGSEERNQYVKLSYVEVYNEVCIDLLQKRPGSVTLMDSKEDGITLDAATVDVHSVDDVLECIQYGEQRRKVGVTVMNDKSSRSHTVLTLLVANFDHPKDSENVFRYASLSFVDLAGSEGVRTTGSVKGKAKQESRFINKSLLALSLVISRLANHQSANKDGGARSRPGTPAVQGAGIHVGFRDSKITRLLKPYLNGSAMVSVIACLNPTNKHHDESKNTVQFALAARKVQVQPSTGMGLVSASTEETQELDALRRIVRQQQQMLEQFVNRPRAVLDSEPDADACQQSVVLLEEQLNQANQNTQEALEHCAYLSTENTRLSQTLSEARRVIEAIRQEEPVSKTQTSQKGEQRIEDWEQLKATVRKRDLEMLETVSLFEERQALLRRKVKVLEGKVTSLEQENCELRSKLR